MYIISVMVKFKFLARFYLIRLPRFSILNFLGFKNQITNYMQNVFTSVLKDMMVDGHTDPCMGFLYHETYDPVNVWFWMACLDD